tara:strand:- start:158 stop:367 length:210 start_codon:yes stop_codon:yes gene_type:complete
MLKTLIKHWLGFAEYSNYVDKRFIDERAAQDANHNGLASAVAGLQKANRDIERHINYLQHQDKETQGNG